LIRRTLATAAIVLLPSPWAKLAAADGGGEWTPLAPTNLGRAYAGMGRVGDKVYVVGGVLETLSATDSVEEYDSSQNQWRFVAALPRARSSPSVAEIGDKLFVIGGLDSSFTARKEMFIYDAPSNSWSEGPPLPQRRSGGAAIALGSRIFYMGGYDSGRLRLGSTGHFSRGLGQEVGFSKSAPVLRPSTVTGTAANGRVCQRCPVRCHGERRSRAARKIGHITLITEFAASAALGHCREELFYLHVAAKVVDIPVDRDLQIVAAGVRSTVRGRAALTASMMLAQ